MLRKMVLLPCAETELTAKNVMLGWRQDLLTAKGKEQAKKAGQQLAAAGFSFDVLFTSVQKQSIHTAWTALMETGAVAVQHVQSYRLNERFCGELQGLTMQEAEAKHGKDTLKEWMQDAPPALGAEDPRNLSKDPSYRALPLNARPNTESMQAVCDRMMPAWTDSIGPFVLSGKSVLVVGHEGSLRAIAKTLEGLSDSEALNEQLPQGVPVVYEVDDDLDFIRKYALDSLVRKRLQRPAAAPAPVAAAGLPKPKKVVPKKPAPPPPKIKEAYTFNVKIISAKGLRDSDWLSGNSDPYVWGKVVGKTEKTFRTPTLSIREEIVTWNHLEKLQLKHGDRLQLFAYDDDWGPDDMLGMCELKFDDLDNDFEGRLRLLDENGKAAPSKAGKGAFLTVAVQEEE